MKIRLIILLLITIMVSSSALADECGESFQLANEKYKNGDYAGAISLYEEIISQGTRDSVVYYNLGNAFFKSDSLGKAVLSYKRGLRILPGDPDIEHNLEHVLSFIKDAHVKTPFEEFTGALFYMFNINALALFVHFTYILLFIMLSVWIFIKRKTILWINVSLAMVLLVSGLWFYGRVYSQDILRRAIVVHEQGQVRNGPDEEYSVGFTVPEGKELIIISEKYQWYEVGIKKEGVKGWIRKGEVEEI